MKKQFTTIVKTALILVYLVIIAGAMVRMTGSGMGCPDWPKCFGYYIPPTDIAELTWAPNRTFEKGQVIIKEETLLIAKEDFSTTTAFNASHWKKYTKHDYALFNPLHTWIEYINRLIGALAGLGCFIMAIAAFKFWKENKKITLFSWLVVFMMGFQGWLGAKVVYSVLNPVKITIHMVMALLIVAVLLYIIQLAKPKVTNVVYNKTFRNLLFIALVLTLIQITIGTQVRQFIDEQVKNGLTESIFWLQKPTLNFYIHRSFSILVLLINGYLFYLNRNKKLGFTKINWVLLLIAIEVASGVAMNYLDFPFGSQALHLVIASLLFGVQFYLILEAKKTIQSSF